MTEEIMVELMIFVAGMTGMGLLASLLGKFITRRQVKAPDLGALESRLTRIEQIVESTAIEVERISEGQRFTTKLLAGQAGAAPPPAPPARLPERVITPR
jgi:hypothetical protein